MKSVNFHPREALFTSPDPDIGDLPVLPITYSDGDKGLVSCWQPSLMDRLRILIGKPVYLVLLSSVQPPVYLGTDREVIMGREDEQKPDPNYNGDTRMQT